MSPDLDAEWRAAHTTYSARGEVDPTAAVSARGEISISASPEAVWRVLTDVVRWSRIRSDVTGAAFEGGVAPGARFTWSTRDVTLVSTFGRVVRPDTIAWSTWAPGLIMTVRYDLTAAAGGQTKVRLHEALAAPAYPQLDAAVLQAGIGSWLEGLKAAVTARAF